MTIGILVPVLADGYHAEVMTGIGDSLLEEKYFYFIAHHRHRADLIEQYPRMLISRGAEGLITIDTNLVDKLPLPVVAIAGHRAYGRSDQCSPRQSSGRGTVASSSLRSGSPHHCLHARAVL